MQETESNSNYVFGAIGFVRSPFKDTYGIPRQPGLASSARGVVKLGSDPDLKTAIRSLDEFSHLWIVFVFHDHGGNKWKPSIRPPRLGGARKVGVLASRSPHRPNPIGISAVKIERIDFDVVGGPEIHVLGIDLLDGTPVLDIKPYIPYADAWPDASAGWAAAPIERVAVTFGCDVPEEVRDGIFEVLSLDPRPAYQKRKVPLTTEGATFGVDFAGYEATYEIRDGGFFVTKITHGKAVR